MGHYQLKSTSQINFTWLKGSRIHWSVCGNTINFFNVCLERFYSKLEIRNPGAYFGNDRNCERSCSGHKRDPSTHPPSLPFSDRKKVDVCYILSPSLPCRIDKRGRDVNIWGWEEGERGIREWKGKDGIGWWVRARAINRFLLLSGRLEWTSQKERRTKEG